MIRRAIIFTSVLTVLAAGLCLLSYVWQYGYVGSWFTVGMREGRLWYIWRSEPITDARGFYSDTASAVNRAMHNINATARFDSQPAWDWVIGFAVFVAYVLLLVAAFKVLRLRARRWVTILLASATLLSAASWLGSQFRTLEYNGTSMMFSVSNGTLSLYTNYPYPSSTIGPWTTPPTRSGWTLSTAGPSLRVNWGDWVSVSRWGGVVLLNLPIAIMALVLLPAVVVCAHSRRRKPGHCRRCGYDLTGNISGICPECGQNIEAREAPAAKSSLVSPPNR